MTQNNDNSDSAIMANLRRQQQLLNEIAELEAALAKERRMLDSMISEAQVLATMAAFGKFFNGK
jgi:hypothetical protein